jgi:hypothetical protein
MPVLADEQGRGQHRHQHLDDEHDRRDLRGRPPLQRAHLGQEPDAGRQARGRGPGEDEERAPGVQRVGDELRRQPAPRQRGARAERHEHAAAGESEGHERQRPDAAENGCERGGSGVLGRGVGRRGRQQRDAAEDAQDRERLADADGLVQVPRADDEQQRQAEGQRRLHDRQRREQQRRGLQRPAEHVQRRSRQPAAPAREPQQQRGAQGVAGGCFARVEGLERESQVVHRRRRTRRNRSEDDRRHGRPPP